MLLLATTPTGLMISVAVGVLILLWCIYRVIVTMNQRKQLLRTIQEDDFISDMKLETMEDKGLFASHVQRNVFCRYWKDLYRPAFFTMVGENYIIKSEDP